MFNRKYRKKTSFSALVSSRMAGVTLVLIASFSLHATQAPYAKAGHFWDEVGDFHGDRLMFTDVILKYVEIYVEVSALYKSMAGLG